MRALDRIFRRRAVAQAIKKLVTWTPASLFTTGVNGAWYDPSDFSTLFQDAAGTTPVTAVEQPVGLMLDKSGKSPTTWLQKISDPTLSTTTGWSNPAAFSAGKYISGNSSYSPTATIGKLYRYTYTVSTASAGGLAIYICGVQKGTSSPIPAGTYSGTVVAISTKVFEFYDPGWGWTGQIDSVSVEELQGNHAFQSTSANRPTLSARYNLLTKTEDLNGWSAYNVTRATDSLTLTSTSGAAYQGSSTFFNSGNYKIRIKIKAGTNQFASINLQTLNNYATVVFDVLNGQIGETKTLGTGWSASAISITPAENGYWVCEATIAVGTSKADVFAVGFANALTGNSVDSYGNPTGCTSGRTLFVKQADLRVANDALNQPAYQRVNTATDYDTVGFKPYLSFNGVNQWLQTNNIDFTYGDKMFVSAGVRKLSDAATAIFTELSANWNTNNGSFLFTIPDSTGSAGNYASVSRGTATANANQAAVSATVLAPVTNVVSVAHDISGNLSSIRLNGSANGVNGIWTKGSGNFGNYPLYIGARAGTSFFFNGRLYGLVVAGKQASASEIASTETFINQKTGAY